MNKNQIREWIDCFAENTVEQFVIKHKLKDRFLGDSK